MTHDISLAFDSLGEELRALKISLLNQVNITSTSFKLSFDDPLPEQLLWASRVFHMDHIELYFSFSINGTPQESITTIVSPQNELRTLTFLTKEVANIADPSLRSSTHARLDSLLNQYSTCVPSL